MMPMANKAILALDQGTHASRATVYSTQGEILYRCKRKVGLTRHGQHIVEQDANEILASVQAVMHDAQHFATTHDVELLSAGLATQRSTVVAWNLTNGQPLHRALSWQDTRAHARLAGLKECAELVKTRTGLRLSAHASASKLKWLLEQQVIIAHTADADDLALGPISSFLLFHLLHTRPFIVDHSNAARTMLFNISKLDWDPHLLNTFGITPRRLPRTVPVRHAFGTLNHIGVPLTAVNGDQAAALYANGPVDPECAAVNMGTGAFVMIDTGLSPVMHPRLLSGITDSNRKACRYALEGTVNGAGAALEWAKTNWGIDVPQDTTWPGVKDPPIFINTVGGLGSPWWRAGASPTLHGGTPEQCTQESERCLTAVFESIVFEIFANLEQMIGAGMTFQKLRIGGGLSRYDYMCQALADLSAMPVDRSTEPEITSRGIAWQAAQHHVERFTPVKTQCFQPHYNVGFRRRYLHALDLIDRLNEIAGFSA